MTIPSETPTVATPHTLWGLSQLRFRMLIGAVLGGVFTTTMTFGLSWGWMGLNMLRIPVIYPSPLAYIATGLHRGLLIGALGTVLGMLLVWPPQRWRRWILLAIMVTCVTVPFIFMLAHIPGPTAMPFMRLLWHGVALILLALLSPLLWSIMNIIELMFQHSHRIGMRVFAGCVVLAATAGLATTLWAGMPTSPGNPDSHCLQSLWVVHRYAQGQGWGGYTLNMVECEGAGVESASRATILVAMPNAQDQTCQTDNWAQSIFCFEEK